MPVLNRLIVDCSHKCSEALGDRPIPLGRCVLVAHGHGRGCVSESGHQFAHGGPRYARPSRTAPSQIVEMQPGNGRRPTRRRPFESELGPTERVTILRQQPRRLQVRWPSRQGHVQRAVALRFPFRLQSRSPCLRGRGWPTEQCHRTRPLGNEVGIGGNQELGQQTSQTLRSPLAIDQTCDEVSHRVEIGARCAVCLPCRRAAFRPTRVVEPSRPVLGGSRKGLAATPQGARPLHCSSQPRH
jgi:hypothetical protein